MGGLRPEVKGLLEGLEAEVDLAVDVMVPPERLAGMLLGFAAAFPTVQLKLHVEALGAVHAMLLARKATPSISGPACSRGQGCRGVSAGATVLVPVAAPDHPLGRLVQIPLGAGRDHI